MQKSVNLPVSSSLGLISIDRDDSQGSSYVPALSATDWMPTMIAVIEGVCGELRKGKDDARYEDALR
jgi:hypothetical protein